MNTRHHAIVGTLILMLGLISPGALLAQMVIESASPSEAEQGSKPIVRIAGTGFDSTIDQVKFILHCNKKNCPDTGDIFVKKFDLISDPEDPEVIQYIDAEVEISQSAPAASFDITVRSSRGRGGKGTTYRGENKFTVKMRPNLELLSCNDVIENPQGSCTCQFLWNGDNAFLPELVGNCVTSETLNLKHRFRGKLGEDPGNQSTITAVLCRKENGQNCCEQGNSDDCCEPEDTQCVGVEPYKFKGTSVITNSIHRATVRFLDIVIGEGINAGCDGQVKSAISFVLDLGTPDPKTTLPIGSTVADPAMRNSAFHVADMGIYSYSQDEALCHGVEVIRTPDYTAKYSVPLAENEFPARDWKIQVTNTVIFPESYEQAGIVMLGMMPSESINPPLIFSNDIYEAACNAIDYPNPVVIFFGDLTADDPIPQIEGVIESNTIDMESACNSEPIGIMAVGDFEPYPGDIPKTIVDSTTVKVNKNRISGAFTGIDVDEDVVEVNFSGNTLTGDGDANTEDTGIDSDAQCARTKGKPNRISGYDDNSEPDDSGCP